MVVVVQAQDQDRGQGQAQDQDRAVARPLVAKVVVAYKTL